MTPSSISITPSQPIHFVGIGGVGMSAIARILLQMGYSVSGSDLKENTNTIRLKDLGARIVIGHKAANVRRAHCIVVSSAITADNCEYAEAKKISIPIYKRAEMMEFVLKQFPKRIAITGTHGKTTSTAMLAMVFEGADLRPTYLVGSDVLDRGHNAKLDAGQYCIVESDESDGTFLLIAPNIGIVTNIEPEHMNYFKTVENLHGHFSQFMTDIDMVSGYVVVNADDATVMTLAAPLRPEHRLTVGIAHAADVKASDLVCSPEGTRFEVTAFGKALGTFIIQLYGKHHVLNALGAIAVALREGIDPDTIRNSLQRFTGTKRRMQLLGTAGNVSVYDDYGHHPTEIKATLSAAKAAFGRRLVCVFQPHRYSRTRDLLHEFARSFDAADEVIITEIYGAHEPHTQPISAKRIAEEMTAHPHCEFVRYKSRVPQLLANRLRPGDVVITMGAGDIHTVAKELLTLLKNKSAC